MNKVTTINEANLRLAYYRYKAYLTPVAIITVCFILFFAVIIPQFKNWLALQEQIARNKAKVVALQESLSTLTGANDTDLDNQLHVAARALPIEQDLLSILVAINQAGISSGVSINDYSIQAQDAGTSGQQATSFSILVSGTLDNLKQFITAIKTELPLADISEIKTSQDQSSINISFFYKKMPNLVFDDTERLAGLSQQDLSLLDTLSKYDKTKESTTDDIVFQSGQ